MLCPLLLGLVVAMPQAQAARETYLTRTNLTERWITNVIEVSVPLNKFVDVYTTNVVDRFITNTLPVDLTNTIKVTAYRTNVFDAYSTNLVRVDATNVIPVTAYRTNVHTLNLTNFESVLVFQTNWVKTTLTNVSTVSMPLPAPTGAAAASTPLATPEPLPLRTPPSASVVAASGSGAIVISGAGTGKSSVARYAEVKLVAAWRGASTEPMNVLQWKVESETSSVMAYSQDREFKREMPFGTYKVEIKATRGANAAVLVGKGVLRIGPGAVEVADGLASVD